MSKVRFALFCAYTSRLRKHQLISLILTQILGVFIYIALYLFFSGFFTHHVYPACCYLLCILCFEAISNSLEPLIERDPHYLMDKNMPVNLLDIALMRIIATYFSIPSIALAVTVYMICHSFVLTILYLLTFIVFNEVVAYLSYTFKLVFPLATLSLEGCLFACFTSYFINHGVIILMVNMVIVLTFFIFKKKYKTTTAKQGFQRSIRRQLLHREFLLLYHTHIEMIISSILFIVLLMMTSIHGHNFYLISMLIMELCINYGCRCFSLEGDNLLPVLMLCDDYESLIIVKDMILLGSCFFFSMFVIIIQAIITHSVPSLAFISMSILTLLSMSLLAIYQGIKRYQSSLSKQVIMFLLFFILFILMTILEFVAEKIPSFHLLTVLMIPLMIIIHMIGIKNFSKRFSRDRNRWISSITNKA